MNSNIFKSFDYSSINAFLTRNSIWIKNNPCVSPDFCLNWDRFTDGIKGGVELTEHKSSSFSSVHGEWILVEDQWGDHAWRLVMSGGINEDLHPLSNGFEAEEFTYFPASFENLVRLKNLVQESDPENNAFPTSRGNLGKSTLGIGARFTTLHWDGVDWAMTRLGMGLTANQNSIPRELVYDVNEMLAGNLDTVPFPFIGCDVPEGHQGQSVEGMTHGCILAKFKNGFHKLGIPWSFNADHQPIGGKFDKREDQLVAGCMFASYITFDLSPELAQTDIPESEEKKARFVEKEVPVDLVHAARKRVENAGLFPSEDEFNGLLAYVWPALKKMKVRDDKYKTFRKKYFTTDLGCDFLRELSIDELPGLTTPETTAVMLALSFEMGMPIHFVAPAFGFQKNIPYPDNHQLREMIKPIWAVCESFGVSIGLHSGSGKSAENYQVAGEVTGSNLEIKTSGRYTYEMGVALHGSTNQKDQELWRDWYAFTVKLASNSCFSTDETEQKMAREFVRLTIGPEKMEEATKSEESCRYILNSLEPSPEHFFWFEYNFLYVLAADGSSEKRALGDHSPKGYQQRQRFYSISDEGRLLYAKRVVEYILFLAENTGLATGDRCKKAREELVRIKAYREFIESISKS
jgi:hypothetical protein